MSKKVMSKKGGKRSGDGDLEAALEVRGFGGEDEAESALRALLKGGDKETREIAQYELALLLHSLGRHKEGDELASALGFRYRLNDAIFEGKGGAACEGVDGMVRALDGAVPEPLLHQLQKGVDGMVRALDGAVPDALVHQLQKMDGAVPEALLGQQLQKVFAAESDFWDEHGYPTDSFFSYNQPLSPTIFPSSQAPAKKRKTEAGKEGETSSKASSHGEGAPAGGALMEQLGQVLLPLAEEFLKGKAGVESMEWWAHKRSGRGAGHQLHFDLDEVAVAEEGTYPHPLVSCVLYLQGCGGPTLVTDVRVGDEGTGGVAAKAKAFLCPPATGRLLLFSGDLMHGVCPCAAFDPAVPRTTLMIGLWPAGVRTAPASAPPLLGPNMTGAMPSAKVKKVKSAAGGQGASGNGKAAAAARGGEWRKLCVARVAAGGAEEGSNVAKASKDRAPLVLDAGALWQKVRGAADQQKAAASGKRGSGGGMLDIGKWFLRGKPSSVRQLCLGPPPQPKVVQGPSEQEERAGVKQGVAVQGITLEQLMMLRGGP
ncbi:hypothetical protein T484DRAFT_1905118 [Baffinella frigidus]|nr:hypothetical protein T484DRAFT_1905118 [Cryptophyta sp. CCMP2293]